MENIGLFSGAFDSVYNDRLHVARALVGETSLGTVVSLSAGDPYHKPQATRTSVTHRPAMAELAAAKDVRFTVNDCDIVRGGATYTFDMVQISRQRLLTTRLWWLLGSSSLMKLRIWKKWQTLVKQTHIAVAMRRGDGLGQTPHELHAWLDEALQNGSIRILQAPLYDINSTRIQQDIRNGSPPDGLIPPQVARYIREHGLYR